MSEHVMLVGGVSMWVHDRARCDGQVCCVHQPTNHVMSKMTQYYRGDRGIMERICDHGIGHPDPDDLRIRTGDDIGVHGCDGCCREPRHDDGAT